MQYSKQTGKHAILNPLNGFLDKLTQLGSFIQDAISAT